MSAEYAKENKQNKQTAKQLKANAIEEQAEATEELIANLTEAHTRQIESLIKANTVSPHQSVSTVERNIPSRRKMNAGNWTRMLHHAQHHGSQPKTPEGARGLK